MSQVANCFGPYLSLERSDRDDLGTVEELRVAALQWYQARPHPTSLSKLMAETKLGLSYFVFYDAALRRRGSVLL